MNEKIYGLSKDPWPYDYVVSALQFLALPEDEFISFIPSEIEETIYDGGGGCVVSKDPLVITFSFLLDFVSPGRTWDEWIEDSQLEDIGLESIFKKLYLNIVRIQDIEIDFEDQKEIINQSRNLSKNILIKIGLYEKHEFPLFSWSEMVHG